MTYTFLGPDLGVGAERTKEKTLRLSLYLSFSLKGDVLREIFLSKSTERSILPLTGMFFTA